MPIAIPGVRRNARSEALWSLPYMELSYMRIANHGVKDYANCNT